MLVICIALLITMLAGFWRIARGPAIADRLLGLQMNSTTSIALLLVLAEWRQEPAIRDIGVVLAILAACVTAALVQILRRRSTDISEEGQS